MLVALVLATRGLPAYLALTGFLPVPYLLAASFLGPRIGPGVFLGAAARRIDLLRMGGACVPPLGVLLILGRR